MTKFIGLSSEATPDQRKIGKKEFVVLMALMTSIVALAIDGMLPAFPDIGTAFEMTSPQLPLIVSVLFLGFGIGQLVFGPISDYLGRKVPIYYGIGIFLLGSVMAGIAHSMELFLLGRALQGFGGASPRIVSIALIRDEYAGDDMARIMSLVMSVFILVPAFAPSLGQGILYFAEWRSIFLMLFVFAAVVGAWFFVRQHETLPKSRRRKFSIQEVLADAKETFSYKTSVCGMIISGLVFGAFVGYLGTAQEIFDKIYDSKDMFPIYFGIISLALGGASLFNARLVMALGMRKLIVMAFVLMALTSTLLAVYLEFFYVGQPPLWAFLSYMMVTCFAVGFLFGNLNALAMVPLGHIAGIGSAIIGFVQIFIAVTVGTTLGYFLHGSVVVFVLFMSGISLLSLFIMKVFKP